MNFSGFLNPIGFIGFLSLPVILVLHLMRERNKLYIVSSLKLWSFLEREVRGSRVQRIPITLLLLLDLLIAALFSLAWAQPQISIATNVKGMQQYLILLDVSSSMRASDVAPSRFSQAQIQIVSLLGKLGPRDVATVVAFGSTAHWVGDTRQVGLPELLNEVTAQKPGETGNALPEALALALATTDQNIPVEIHIFTDLAFANKVTIRLAGWSP